MNAIKREARAVLTYHIWAAIYSHLPIYLHNYLRGLPMAAAAAATYDSNLQQQQQLVAAIQ